MESLLNKKCVSCEGGTPPLSVEEIKQYLPEVKDWEVFEDPPSPKASDGQGKKIAKNFKFKDFKEAMEFVNKVASIADQENHHPDIAIHYNKVEIILWTHKIDGLSENDFILAVKIDNL